MSRGMIAAQLHRYTFLTQHAGRGKTSITQSTKGKQIALCKTSRSRISSQGIILEFGVEGTQFTRKLPARLSQQSHDEFPVVSPRRRHWSNQRGRKQSKLIYAQQQPRPKTNRPRGQLRHFEFAFTTTTPLQRFRHWESLPIGKI